MEKSYTRKEVVYLLAKSYNEGYTNGFIIGSGSPKLPMSKKIVKKQR